MKSCRPAYMIKLYNRRKKLQELAAAMQQLGISTLADAKSEVKHLSAEIREIEKQMLAPVRHEESPNGREDSSIRIVPQPRRTSNNH